MLPSASPPISFPSTSQAGTTSGPGGPSGDVFRCASVAARIADIDRIRFELTDARRLLVRDVVPTSLRPAFETALESLRKPDAARTVALEAPALPRQLSDADWDRRLLARYVECGSDVDRLPYGGCRVAFRLLRCRLRDALDLLSPPHLPSELDRDAHLERPVDPGLQQLAAWWAPRLSRDAARVDPPDRARGGSRSGADLSAAREVGDFAPARCEELVHRLIVEGDTDGAWALLCAVRAKDERHLPTMNSYLTLIRAFGEEARGLRAGQVFDRMQGLFPQAMSRRELAQQAYDEILLASGRSQDFARVLDHARAMRRCGDRWDADSLAQAIVASIACRDPGEARRWLAEGRAAGVPIRGSHVMPLVETFAARGNDREQACQVIQESLDRDEGVFTPHLGLTGQVLDVRQEGVLGRQGSARRRTAPSRDLISVFLDFHDRRGRLGTRLDMALARTGEDAREPTRTRDVKRWMNWTVQGHCLDHQGQLWLHLVRPAGQRTLSDP